MPNQLRAVSKEKLDHKAVLLDTGLLIKSFDSKELEQQIFPFLEGLSLVPTISSEIRFEFLRTASFNETFKKRKEFIKDWTVLLPTEKDHEDAIDIARIYKSYGIFPSPTDCGLATLLKKFQSRLFLITLNHKDFPPYLFDRLYSEMVDSRTRLGQWETVSWGVYEFNGEKFKKEYNRLQTLKAS